MPLAVWRREAWPSSRCCTTCSPIQPNTLPISMTSRKAIHVAKLASISARESVRRAPTRANNLHTTPGPHSRPGCCFSILPFSPPKLDDLLLFMLGLLRGAVVQLFLYVRVGIFSILPQTWHTNIVSCLRGTIRDHARYLVPSSCKFHQMGMFVILKSLGRHFCGSAGKRPFAAT